MPPKTAVRRPDKADRAEEGLGGTTGETESEQKCKLSLPWSACGRPPRLAHATPYVGQRGGLSRRSPYAGAGSKLTSGPLGGRG